MLRNILLLVCAISILSPVAKAENKTEEFAAFYSFNLVALKPNLLEAMNYSCMKEKSDKDYCEKVVPSMVDAAIAYYTYRMATEKSMDFFKQMVTCGKDSKALSECPEITSYVFIIHQDFNGVIKALNDLAGKQKK